MAYNILTLSLYYAIVGLKSILPTCLFHIPNAFNQMTHNGEEVAIALSGALNGKAKAVPPCVHAVSIV